MFVDDDEDPKKVTRAGLIGGMLALVFGLSAFARVANSTTCLNLRFRGHGRFVPSWRSNRTRPCSDHDLHTPEARER